jgi:hypothetical protein
MYSLSVKALANVARALVPLVQNPPRGTWGHGGLARYLPAEIWLGKPICTAPDLERMIQRYLAAFGPAAVRDMQAWSGLTGPMPGSRIRSDRRAPDQQSRLSFWSQSRT